MARRRKPPKPRSTLTLYSPKIGGIKERHRGSTGRTIQRVVGTKDRRRRSILHADLWGLGAAGYMRTRVRGGVFEKLHPRGPGGRFKKKGV